MSLPPPLPPQHLRNPGDAWVEGPDGQKYWGRFGAAGLLAWDPARGVLLQHRATWSHHGDTWGIPGGALHSGESAVQAAFREAHEEAGVPPEALRSIGHHVVDLGVWSYTTVIAQVISPFDAVIGDQESVELAWVELARVTDLDLHPAFAAAWPALLQVLEGSKESEAL